MIWRPRRDPLPLTADVSGKPPFSQVTPFVDPLRKPPPADTSWLQVEGRLRRSIQVTLQREADRIVAEARTFTPAQNRPRPAPEAEIPSYTDELIARLDRELAAEEHRQGMRYGRRGHCEDCDAKYRERRLRQLQRRCRHRDVVEMRTLDEPLPERICATCGTTLEVTADDGT